MSVAVICLLIRNVIQISRTSYKLRGIKRANEQSHKNESTRRESEDGEFIQIINIMIFRRLTFCMVRERERKRATAPFTLFERNKRTKRTNWNLKWANWEFLGFEHYRLASDGGNAFVCTLHCVCLHIIWFTVFFSHAFAPTLAQLTKMENLNDLFTLRLREYSEIRIAVSMKRKKNRNKQQQKHRHQHQQQQPVSLPSSSSAAGILCGWTRII